MLNMSAKLQQNPLSHFWKKIEIRKRARQQKQQLGTSYREQAFTKNSYCIIYIILYYPWALQCIFHYNTNDSFFISYFSTDELANLWCNINN